MEAGERLDKVHITSMHERIRRWDRVIALQKAGEFQADLSSAFGPYRRVVSGEEPLTMFGQGELFL